MKIQTCEFCIRDFKPKRQRQRFCHSTPECVRVAALKTVERTAFLANMRKGASIAKILVKAADGIKLSPRERLLLRRVAGRLLV